MNRFDEVRDLLMSLEGDFDKFYLKRDKEAGLRLLKGIEGRKNLA